jgi:hypothetical protein
MTPSCGRLVAVAPERTLGRVTLCKRCIEQRARHGSASGGSIRPATLRPFLRAAAEWVAAHRAEPEVAYALLALHGMLNAAGKHGPKRRAATAKADAALAALRRAGAGPDRILAVHLAVSAAIEDDEASDRTASYRLAQSAKSLCHGVALPRPRPAGLALRRIGDAIDAACGGLLAAAVGAVLAAKRSAGIVRVIESFASTSAKSNQRR